MARSFRTIIALSGSSRKSASITCSFGVRMAPNMPMHGLSFPRLRAEPRSRLAWPWRQQRNGPRPRALGPRRWACKPVANWPVLSGRTRVFIHLSTPSPGCLASVRPRVGLRPPLFLAASVRAVFHLVPDLGPCLAPDHRAAAGGAGLDRQVGFAAHLHRSNLICGSGFARGPAARRGLRLAWRVAMAVASPLWPGARRSAQTASRAAFWAAAGSMIGS